MRQKVLALAAIAFVVSVTPALAQRQGRTDQDIKGYAVPRLEYCEGTRDNAQAINLRRWHLGLITRAAYDQKNAEIQDAFEGCLENIEPEGEMEAGPFVLEAPMMAAQSPTTSNAAMAQCTANYQRRLEWIDEWGGSDWARENLLRQAGEELIACMAAAQGGGDGSGTPPVERRRR